MSRGLEPSRAPRPRGSQRCAACAAALVLAAFTFVIAPAAAPPQAERVPLDELLDRAAWYLDYFVDEFENVVAEETSIQDSSTMLPTFSPMPGGRGGAFPPPPSPSDAARARHRDLRSDFLLVKSPDTEALVPFRDVLEVDGVPVRDREARLSKLFLSGRPGGSIMEQAERIGAEGARYNLGNMRSTIGNPVLGLGVLQRSYQQRFRFSFGRDDRTAGATAIVIEFKETASPAMIRGEAGRDLMAHGRVWIDGPTGRVLKTELQVEQPAIRAMVTTLFRLEDRSGIGVPVEMREQYTLANGNRISTVATYGRFRPFAARASGDLPPPDGSPASAAARGKPSARRSRPSPMNGPAWRSSNCPPDGSRWAAAHRRSAATTMRWSTTSKSAARFSSGSSRSRSRSGAR